MNLRSRSYKVVVALWLVLGAIVVLAQNPQPPGNPVVIGGLTPPLIQNLSVTVGPVGTTVIITGTTFSTVQGTSVVRFNGTVATPTAWSNTSITTTVPVGATTGPVTVQVAGNTSNAVTFTVQLPVPTLTSLSLTNGPIGTGVVLTGTNFGNTQGTSTVAVNGVNAAVTSWANTSVAITIPAAATTGLIRLTTPGGTSNGLTFSVTPQLQSLSVTSGNVGTTVVLTGTTFGATQGASTVTFNGTAATASSWSATSITVTVPAGASSGQVQVIVGGFASNGIVFTVTPPPVLTSLNFNTGPVGTPVTVSGTNFGATQGASTVAFNGLVATATSWSATSINTNVPVGATTGPVTVTVGGVQSNGLTFTVTTAGGGSVAAVDCQWQSVVNAMGIAFNASPKILTVTIPACAPGTTWSNQLSVGEAGWPVTIQGAGATQTFIDATPYGNAHGGGSVNPVITLQQGARITGINLTCGMVQVVGSAFRYDHNTSTCALQWNLWGTAIFADNTNKQALGVNPLTSPLKGLVDNNTFVNQRVLAYRYAATALSEEAGSTVYSEPLGLGTDSAVYVEDNIFTTTTPDPINVIDCQHAGEYVFRYNQVANVYPEAHSARSYSRACRKWEIYNNTFTGNAVEVWFTRGGTGVVWGNIYTGTFGNNNASMDNVRNVLDDGPNSWGLCNGTSPWDGNAGGAPAPGWPCLDQIGRGTDATGPFNGTPPPYSPQPQPLDPAYFWNNKINGSDVVIGITIPESVPYLVLNRDYFNSPSTAKPGYTSYQYPHPLQGSPTLTSLSTTSGPVGTTVTLTGGSWGSRQNASLVKFGTTTATVTAWSLSSITTTVPAGATSGNVTVTVNSVQSNGIAFSVGNPTLTSLSTTSGPTGTQVILTGTNFGATQGASTVQFNATTATATAWSNTSITTTVPVAATTGPVRVTVGGVQSNAITFTVTGAVLTFYVSPSGNDANTCTLAQNIATPKRTLNSGAACLQPNSQLLVRAGTYVESLWNGDGNYGTSHTPVAIPSGTSWNAKVRIAAFPGETVTMRPSGGFWILYFSGNSQYIEFDGINFDGANVTDASIFFEDRCVEMNDMCSAFELITPHHIRIQNADLHHREGNGQTDAAIMLTGANHEILNMSIHGTGGPYGIYIHGGNHLVDHCDIYGTSTSAIQIYHNPSQGHPVPPFNNIVRNSLLHDITQSWFFNAQDNRFWAIIAYGVNNQMYNNVIYNIVPAAQFLPFDAGSGALAITGDQNKVYYNTVANNAILGILTGSATNVEIVNNISFNNGAGNFSNGGGITRNTNNLFGTNPGFINAAGGNFHLDLVTSPASDAGTPTNVPTTTDRDGVTRTGNTDIGAYEWVAH